MIARYDPLLRLLRLALGSRPLRGRLLLAVAAGAAATGCGVALLAVSGFLLARRDCYQATNDARLAAAHRDLEGYFAREPAPLAVR